MRQPRSSISARSASNAGTTFSAGRAYSISRKRTERCAANTLVESVRELPIAPQLRPTSRLMNGIVAGTSLPTLARDLVQAGSDDARRRTTCPTRGSGCRGALSGRRVFTFVMATIGVREPVELEVVVLRGALVERRRAPRPSGFRAVDGVQHERRHALQRDVDEDAQRAEAERHRGKQFGVLGLVDDEQVAGCRHQRRTRRPGSRCRRTARRCRACRSRSRRRSTGGRCRRGSPSRGRSGASSCGTWCRRVPARSVTRDLSRSTFTSPLRSSSSSSTPGATAMPVKLWPAPTALTCSPFARADSTERRTASMESGRSTRCGRTLSDRPQFCQVPPGRVTGRPSLRRGRWASRRRADRRR